MISIQQERSPPGLSKFKNTLWKFQKAILMLIPMVPRALGVSSTLAPWSMAVYREPAKNSCVTDFLLNKKQFRTAPPPPYIPSRAKLKFKR